MKITNSLIFKIIFTFILVNSVVYNALLPNGVVRLFIVALMCISIALLIFMFFKLFLKVKISKYFYILFTLLLLWSSFTFFRSFELNAERLMTMFGHYYFGFGWFLPLAFVFGTDLNNYLNSLNFFIYTLIIGIIFSIGIIYLQNINYARGVVEFFNLLPLLLLLIPYFTKWKKKSIIISFIFFLILSLLLSKRITLILVGLLFISIYFLYIRRKDVSRKNKVGVKIAAFVFSILLIFSASNIVNTVLKHETLSVDTRSFLFLELFSDMNKKELIIGRGVMGTYYSPFFYNWNKENEGGDSSTRSINEVGYLQMILKGGYIMLILYLLILIPSAYLGINRSNNIIAKASGYYIALYLALSLVGFPPIYTTNFLLLWIAVGTTISKKTRSISDLEILERKKSGYVFK